MVEGRLTASPCLLITEINHGHYLFAVGSNAERHEEGQHEGHEQTATYVVSTALGPYIISSSRATKESAFGTGLPVHMSLSPTPKMPSSVDEDERPLR